MEGMNAMMMEEAERMMREMLGSGSAGLDRGDRRRRRAGKITERGFRPGCRAVKIGIPSGRQSTAPLQGSRTPVPPQMMRACYRDLGRLTTGDEKADFHMRMLWTALESAGVEFNQGLTPMGYMAASPGAVLKAELEAMRKDGVSEAAIEKLVNDPDLDGSYVGGYTPLHRACAVAEVNNVKLLLECKANPNAQKTNGSTPLLVAAASRAQRQSRGCTDVPPSMQFLECAKLLLQNSAFDVEQNDVKAHPKCSPVWAAVAHPTQDPNPDEELLPMLRLLLAHGFSADVVLNEQSALHMAAWNGYIGCAEALVIAGADMNRLCGIPPDNSMVTALQMCRREHGEEAAARLVAAAVKRRIETGASRGAGLESPVLHAGTHRGGGGRGGGSDGPGARGPPAMRLPQVYEASDEDVSAALKQTKEAIKTTRRENLPSMWMSMIHGDACPENLQLLEEAKLAFFGGDEFKGERAYTAFYHDLERDKSTWMALYDHPGNVVQAERSCGILGTLATLLRQRGELQEAERVLEMEGEVLARYTRNVPPAGRKCCEELTYKWNFIRYNLLLQTNRKSESIPVFRACAEHEEKYQYDFEQQNFLFMLPRVRKRSIRQCSDSDVRTMVDCILSTCGDSAFTLAPEQQKKVDKKTCAGCDSVEAFRGDYNTCSGCKKVHYCSKECQKADWKSHKRVCAPKTKTK